MEQAATGTGISPVAAVLTVFALLFAAIAWLRLLGICFRRDTPLGLIAFFLPPVALLLLLPQRRAEPELFLLVLAALVSASIAAVL
ncbi:hypothetical protein [Microbulbifer litoralis]|uniref:hypothetical protein n=1 Tax=Microbulbifer litoralis TaxID=2933965 RepID=UPI0020287B54|nr:hypothetical protein [Microbulbifer sp. GX H0434]